ncbi:MAG: hypothetical protein LBM75_07295 [Myxococcales bacterium]|nr:hypothetical protein [Myxococcales bacterium]
MGRNVTTRARAASPIGADRGIGHATALPRLEPIALLMEAEQACLANAWRATQIGGAADQGDDVLDKGHDTVAVAVAVHEALAVARSKGAQRVDRDLFAGRMTQLIEQSQSSGPQRLACLIRRVEVVREHAFALGSMPRWPGGLGNRGRTRPGRPDQGAFPFSDWAASRAIEFCFSTKIEACLRRGVGGHARRAAFGHNPPGVGRHPPTPPQ